MIYTFNVFIVLLSLYLTYSSGFVESLIMVLIVLPIGSITHIVSLVRLSKNKKIKDRQFLFILTIIGFVTIWLPVYMPEKLGVSSGINYFKYENFRCKDQNITLHTPVAVYTFKNMGGAGKISDVNPYFGQILDSWSDTPCCMDSISIKKIYPVGSKFKIEKLFGSSNVFGEGHDSFLLHSNDGVYFWIPTRDIDVNTCAFDYEYSQSYQKISSEKSVNFDVQKEQVFSATPKPYDPKRYYDRILDVLIKNKADTRNKAPVLFVYFPKFKKEKPSYLYKYILNVVSKYLTNTDRYSMKPIEVDSDIFALRYGSVHYRPYHCAEFLQDPYSCLKDLPQWLEKPYETKSIVYDSIFSKSLIEKSKDPYFMVLKSSKYQGYDHILRVYNFEQKLKKSITNLKIYKADENLSHFFHQDGFYIIDRNLTIKEHGPFYVDRFIQQSKYYFNTNNK